MKQHALLRPATFVIALLLAGCGGSQSKDDAAKVLSLAAYTTPREAYGKLLLPAFAEHWKKQTGSEITFEQSFVASGAQARAIVGGFEADVAALSLEPDIQLLVDNGLVKSGWQQLTGGGMVTTSLVVIGVRPGNPRGIRDWADLARPGLKVLTPSPRTSGGAMWNIAAMYGAALRSGAGGDSAGAALLLSRVLANVAIMDKGARESMLTFEQGIGDAVITYENEVVTAREAGQQIDYVSPGSTILIENPVAVIDSYVDRRGTRAVAEEFVRFLVAPEAQRLFVRYGYRPVNPTVLAESTFPAAGTVFTIADLGGWPNVVRNVFAPGAVFDRAQTAATSR